MKSANIPPIALSVTLTTNLLNCGVTSMSGPIGLTVAQPYLLITHIHFVNTDSNVRNFTLYKGASNGNVAGTALFKNKAIAANDTYDWYPQDLRFDSGDYLVGGDDDAKIVMLVDAEISISG